MADIKITTFFGFPLRSFKISLIDPAYLFELKDKIVYNKKFEANKKTSFSFNLPNKKYILKIGFKGDIYTKIISPDTTKLKIPFLFPLNNKNKELSQSEYNDLLQECRWDKGKCYKCKKLYKDYLDAHKCPYCNKYFCSKHRLPEDHGCEHPEKPELYKMGAGGRIIYHKDHARYSTE